MSSILVIDGEPAVSVVLESALHRLGHRAILTAHVAEALEALPHEAFDLVIADDRMASATGPGLVESLRRHSYEGPVIFTSSYGSVEHAVLAMRSGAVDYLAKPVQADALRIAVTHALESGRLRREAESVRRGAGATTGPRAIVGRSLALRAVMETISAVASTRAVVLLEGESGTGKELFARALHEHSPRRDRPFVTVNCAALPEGLVESTLFGHERGAFTGASARATGAFERAHGGTLMLDEISEMRLDLQAKLLRVIQEQEFDRVGGDRSIKVDVRIVATTNRELAAEVEAGRFRRDLYYRLSVVPIHAPALRERPEDIPLLVQHFVTRSSATLDGRTFHVPRETLEALARRDWPGNVRELENAVERAVILSKGSVLAPEMFLTPARDARFSSHPALVMTPRLGSARVSEAAPSHAPTALLEPPSGEEPVNLKELERRAIDRALTTTGGHRSRAARLLGISERTLRNKLNGPVDREVAEAA